MARRGLDEGLGLGFLVATPIGGLSPNFGLGEWRCFWRVRGREGVSLKRKVAEMGVCAPPPAAMAGGRAVGSPRGGKQATDRLASPVWSMRVLRVTFWRRRILGDQGHSFEVAAEQRDQ